MRDVTPAAGSGWRLPAALFGITLITTTAAGALQRGVNPLEGVGAFLSGLPFSLTLVAILLGHEMGHFFTSRRHRVAVTLPFFIPAPSFIGTFGALIRMKGAIWDRRALLDIGVSGPLAGTLLSLPALAWGLAHSRVVDQAAGAGGMMLGDSLLMLLMQALFAPPLVEGATLALHPVAFAGWIGLFVTALNLIPVGQLDGGHIAHALLPRFSHLFFRMVHLALILMGLLVWDGWLVWGVLLFFLGLRHPPVMMPLVPLDGRRRVLGAAALLLFVLTFVPVPFSFL